ncbi:periplasmic heavy metal sensor [Nereida sp. MMG025]|uniref:periplasmic heavy metal sensor n=1 Tax=Nereida sp. MMG025 TaxID=2909981 RepID=UPI001F243F71|nr:periplasmic heavy metal sensor [Nereida sp. MMG025]MCF6445108.1 periplasmic heavy metal sensor [Nereida sp. MMG025]
MALDPIPDARGKSWLKVVLVVSLALNLLVVGVIAGGAIAGRKGDDPRADRRTEAPSGFMAITRALPKQDRRAIGQQLRSLRQQDTRDPQTRARRDAQIAAWVGLLEADVFDLETARGLASDQVAAAQTRRARAQDVALDYIAQMPPEARQAVADRLKDRSR